MARGRPRKYKSAKEMQDRIDQYFAECDEQGRPYTITGLALALGMDRQRLLNYSADDEFYDTIKKAKVKCECYAEERLFQGGNVAGVIFNLKNNYGWRDKTEQEINVNVSLADALRELYDG